MEEQAAFLAKLEEALEQRRGFLDTVRLPQVKEGFHSLQTLFESLLNMLIRKGLLREDPYKYDRQITEISVPSDDPMSETEKRDEVSYRLSAYRSQLDYLNNYYQFSVAFLDLPRLKKVSGLLAYVSWKNLTDMAKSPTTRAFAQYIGKIKLGTDTMATGIVKDSLTQVEKVLRQVNAGLAELVSFHRETFKCELRRSVLPRLAANGGDAAAALKRLFAQAQPGRPYYPELAQEVLQEELGEEAAARRDALLKALQVKEEKKDAARPKEAPHKELLLEAARILALSATDLTSAAETIAENALTVAERRLGLGEKLRRWLSRGGGGREEEQLYEVEYVEGTSSAVKSEKISLRPFLESVHKKASLLSSLAVRSGSAQQKLESSPEDQVLEFVSRLLSDLTLMHRRMGGLNTYFLSEAPREQRARMKGVKLQLTAIRNAVVKANQKKHDFVARNEEEEQMKRLGIR
jgi:hypothetical protein